MPSLVQDKNGNFLVAFRWGGKQFTRSLDTRDRAIADACVARVDETIMRLRRGWATMPEAAEPGIFIVSGGMLAAKPASEPPPATDEEATPLTLVRMFDLYVTNLPAGKKEANTLLTERIHRGHLVRILGGEAPVLGIKLAEAQRYVAVRSQETWRGRSIGPDTIRKELKTLRFIWAWAHALEKVETGCSWKLGDLHLGKDLDREPFRTMEEIKRRIRRGGLDAEQTARLWGCLYLTGAEVSKLLDYARDHGSTGFAYPMVCFCALTGARRSELCRSRIDDFDFKNRTVHLRERKRDQTKKETTRVVDLHDRLRDVMRAWFSEHPGGQYTLAQDDGETVSVDLASDHFRRTIAGSKVWRVIPGFHTLRHSFASIMACRGVDQRIIDDFMGHQTPEMRDRYQHLFPKALRRAIDELLA
jgi:integrase